MEAEPSSSSAAVDSPRLARVIPLPHPQGCRGYLIVDAASRQAIAVDPHLDQVAEAASRLSQEGWDLKFVVDSHTHADHPSGSGRLADWFGAVRVAHERAGHRGVGHHPKDGEVIGIGSTEVRFLHSPGHTPDGMVLVAGDALLSGDTIFIGSVARTDFLGGDAGALWDSIQRVLATVPDATFLYPGHDYQGRIHSTIGDERAKNPWLQMAGREEFAKRLTAKRPPKPANMDELVRMNKEGVEIPPRVPAKVLVERVKAGAAGSVIDVRMDVELAAERIAGTRHIPLDQIQSRADEVRATPAPRYLLCKMGSRSARAQQALDAMGVQGLVVVEGGLDAYVAAGGELAKDEERMSIQRQVQIAAGSLVVIGVALGFLLHPLFTILSAFIGAGLVFAGVTDTCGMATCLSKAPWNRVKTPPPAASGGCAATLPSACAAGAPPPPPSCSADAPR